MKDHINRLFSFLISLIIFPIAPIAVIVAISVLCRDIWRAAHYTPGEDGGEFELGLTMFAFPMLLIIIALLLCGLTVLTRWVERLYTPGNWWRLLMGFIRVLLVGFSLLLFVTSTSFYMGGGTGIEHWEVVCGWIASATVAGAFIVQQYRRLVE